MKGKEQNHVTFDNVVRLMLNEFLIPGQLQRTNLAPCKLSTLLRWSIFGSLNDTNATVEAFSFEECLNSKQDNIHQNLEKGNNVVVRNWFGDWNRDKIILGMTKLNGEKVKYNNVIVDHVGKTDVINNLKKSGQSRMQSESIDERMSRLETDANLLYKKQYRECFFNKIIPLMGDTGFVSGSIYLPVHPWFV